MPTKKRRPGQVIISPDEKYRLARGRYLEIVQDTDPEDPCESLELFGDMVCWHSRYTLGHEQPGRDISDLDWMQHKLASECGVFLDDRIDYLNNNFYTKKVSEFEKDTTYTGHKTPHQRAYELADQLEEELVRKTFDKYFFCAELYLMDHSGISISMSDFRDCWDSGRVGYIYISKTKAKQDLNVSRFTKKQIKRVYEAFNRSVKCYDDYLRGYVYGYNIVDKDEAVEEACYGFSGYDLLTNGILDTIDQKDKRYLIKHNFPLV